MTTPVPAQTVVGQVRLRILGPDTTTFRGNLSGFGARGNHSKAIDGDALSFTAAALEAAMVADPDMLEDAFAVPQIDRGSWQSFGTPYMLAPGSGTVVGASQGAARDVVPVGVGALHGMTAGCIVLPAECDPDAPTFSQTAGGLEGNRYYGYQSKDYDPSLHSGTWVAGTIYTPPADSPKEDEPEAWDPGAAEAEWVGDPEGSGGLLLAMFPEFTLTERTTVKAIVSGDEGPTVFLDGPNTGCVILSQSGAETSYTDKEPDRIRLEAGTYKPSAMMLLIDSEGGDGNDSIRFAIGTIDDKGAIETVLSASGADTLVRRQARDAERPGLSPLALVIQFLQENADLGVTWADILLTNKTFSGMNDTAESSPSPEDCREWVWPLGTPLSSVLADLSEDADFDLSTAFELSAWLDRGESPDITLTPGEHLLEFDWQAEKRGPNGYLTESQEGFDLVLPTITDGAPRVLGSFDTGASGSIGRARRNARSAIRQSGRVRRYFRAKVAALADAVPEDDFVLCDEITAIDHHGDPVSLEVTDIAWEQGQGTTVFELSLGEV